MDDKKSVTFKLGKPQYHKLGKLALDMESSRSKLAKDATLELLAEPRKPATNRRKGDRI